MQLKKILKGLDIIELSNDIEGIDIKNIAYDSRKVREGFLFVAIDGTITDGHSYLKSVIENGAGALLVQKKCDVPNYIPVVRIKDTRYGLANVSDKFFNHPSGKLNMVGITGTKGKTTTSYMIKSMLESSRVKTGLIGTVEKLIDNRVIYMERTTPESYDLQSLLAEMVDNGIETSVMEVSSQGLMLHRVSCCDFDIGIFTNISRAHIGPKEHSSFEDYFDSKKKLFKMCKNGIINNDTKFSRELIEEAECKVVTYGIHNSSDVTASNIKKFPGNVEYLVTSPWYNGIVNVGVPGEFSVYNSLAAIASCGVMGVPFEFVKKGLEHVNVRGRVEKVKTDTDYTVIIDYAHSPDSLENILTTIKDYAPGRVVCLFGCGGDRDKMMRPMMGEISGRLADYTVITSDNPRSEEPELIINDIEEGIKETSGEYITIVNRRDAIKHVLSTALRDDIIILAGKGHETYQTFNDKTIHFDEREIVNEILREI